MVNQIIELACKTIEALDLLLFYGNLHGSFSKFSRFVLVLISILLCFLVCDLFELLLVFIDGVCESDLQIFVFFLEIDDFLVVFLGLKLKLPK